MLRKYSKVKPHTVINIKNTNFQKPFNIVEYTKQGCSKILISLVWVVFLWGLGK